MSEEQDGSTQAPRPDPLPSGRSGPRRPRPVTLLAGVAAVAVAGAGLLGALLVQGSGAAAPAGRVGTITVTGSGSATGAPDTASIQLGVSTSGSSAASALDTNNTEVAALDALFRRLGVPPSGLQTSNLDLQPTYDPTGAITGYQADNDLTVTMHDLSRAGQAIDAATHVTGNDIRLQGISFSISGTSHLLARARIAAMADAHGAAAQLAAAAGTSLGPIRQVTDQQDQPPPPVLFGATALHASASAAGTVPVPVQGGTQQLTVQVQVVYDLSS